jgi:hypothetical protein
MEFAMLHMRCATAACLMGHIRVNSTACLEISSQGLVIFLYDPHIEAGRLQTRGKKRCVFNRLLVLRVPF